MGYLVKYVIMRGEMSTQTVVGRLEVRTTITSLARNAVPSSARAHSHLPRGRVIDDYLVYKGLVRGSPTTITTEWCGQFSPRPTPLMLMQCTACARVWIGNMLQISESPFQTQDRAVNQTDQSNSSLFFPDQHNSKPPTTLSDALRFVGTLFTHSSHNPQTSKSQRGKTLRCADVSVRGVYGTCRQKEINNSTCD